LRKSKNKKGVPFQRISLFFCLKFKKFFNFNEKKKGSFGESVLFFFFIYCKYKLGGVGEATLYNGLYGEVLPERGTFFEASGRVGISQVEVYEKVGKSVIKLFKRAFNLFRT